MTTSELECRSFRSFSIKVCVIWFLLFLKSSSDFVRGIARGFIQDFRWKIYWWRNYWRLLWMNEESRKIRWKNHRRVSPKKLVTENSAKNSYGITTGLSGASCCRIKKADCREVSWANLIRIFEWNYCAIVQKKMPKNSSRNSSKNNLKYSSWSSFGNLSKSLLRKPVLTVGIAPLIPSGIPIEVASKIPEFIARQRISDGNW